MVDDGCDTASGAAQVAGRRYVHRSPSPDVANRLFAPVEASSPALHSGSAPPLPTYVWATDAWRMSGRSATVGVLPADPYLAKAALFGARIMTM